MRHGELPLVGRPAVTHSSFDGQSLLDVLVSRYDVEADRCALVASGVNDTYEVDGPDGKRIIRVYRRGWRTDNDVAWELDLLASAARGGAAVSDVIPTSDGARILRMDAPEGERLAALFCFAPGSAGTVDVEYSRAYGAAAASVHNAVDGFASDEPRFTLDLEHLIDEPLAAVRGFFGERPDDLGYLHDLARRVRKELEVLLDDLEWAACHGDFHGGNANRAPDGTITFFDFDCGGLGWRAYELAVFRWSSRALRIEAGNDERWHAYLDGYRSTRPVGEADLAAVPLFIAARHLWLMGLHAWLVPQAGNAMFGDPQLDRHMKVLRYWDDHLAPWAAADQADSADQSGPGVSG